MEHCRGRRDQALTARQLSIVALVAAGVPYRTIAAQLGEKSENTIKDQVRKMCKKLKLPSNGRALASWYTQYIAQVRSHDKLDA